MCLLCKKEIKKVFILGMENGRSNFVIVVQLKLVGSERYLDQAVESENGTLPSEYQID